MREYTMRYGASNLLDYTVFHDYGDCVKSRDLLYGRTDGRPMRITREGGELFYWERKSTIYSHFLWN